MKRFRGPHNDQQRAEDTRDILWFLLNVLIAAPDPGGELTQVREAIADFADRRREDVDVEA